MSFQPAEYGFDLNNREIVSLIYIAIIVAALSVWKRGRKSLLAVIRAFFGRKLVLVWVTMTLYVSACVYLLAWLNIWVWPNFKSTLIWWLTVGFISMFEAERLKERPDKFRKLVLKSFTITAVLIFVVELVSFPLWIEFLMLPALVFLTLLIAVAEQKPEHANALKLFKSVQVLFGLLIFGFSVALVVNNGDEFWSLNTLREFALPFMLWLLFVPFIYLLAMLMAYEESFVRLRLGPQTSPVIRYARWRALLAFRFDIDAVKRLSRNLRMWDIKEKAGVRAAIREIRMLQKRQKNPPPVDPADGWSPYESGIFLQEHGVVTDDYHRVMWGWHATSPNIKLCDKFLADRVSYEISGNEHTVTELSLLLNGWKNDDDQEMQLTFDVLALTLMSKVLDTDLTQQVFASAIALTPEAVELEDIKVLYEYEEWGKGKVASISRKLTIRHARHDEIV